MRIRKWTFLTTESQQARNFIINSIQKKFTNLEETILKTKKFFRASRYKEKTFFALSIYWLYQSLRQFKNYPPKSVTRYNKFKEFIKKAERDIKGKGEISEETADIIMKLFRKK
ncbi:MAG: hypothetical protein OH319_04485 [Candidatus Parvarchaeota archaeon]|nr:hypothetical protein [Candidatus Jingweiarchaeum tengchongense]MCW1297905.1 hypothetical protein [Candidatus Jingweiarchaeum tengchongense]MCW1300662.1 hypothetical protein [Candidatus Jingweiarchaeum tengchongense]MCW1311054.1 hypothetical protein [Candidatus Jingweiarchaeum tengchongense]